MADGENPNSGLDVPKIEVFYADPVDEHGNVIGTAKVTNVTTPWGPVEAIKVPHQEIVLAPESTIRAKVSGVIQVRKARWGWWVDGRWCPTRKIRDHEIKQVRRRTGKQMVRTRG